MRERAWAKRAVEREQALTSTRGPSLWARVAARLRRGTVA
jgi:hypothetical protein